MPLYSIGDRRVELRGKHHYLAPGAQVAGGVVLENEVSLWFNVVIRGDNDPIHIGEQTNIQDGAVLHSDPGFPLRVGARCTVGHKAMLHGCTIGEGTLIGIGAVVMNGASIGAGSLVGAGALVPEGKSFPPGVLLVGAPARVVRELKPEEQARLLWAAQNYVERSYRYAAELKEQPAKG